jgi:hypothetical protein
LAADYGGLYAAFEFEKRRFTDIEVTLISEVNFFLFTPMLLDWTLDVFFSKDFVQYLHERAPVMTDPPDPRPAGDCEPANQLAAVQSYLI